MKSHCFTMFLAIGLWFFPGIAGPARAQGTKDLTIEGQVKAGVHKLKLSHNSLYQIEVKGKGFSPNVSFLNYYVPNRIPFGKEPNTYSGLFFPPKTGEYTLTVLPQQFNPPEGLLDYTVTVKTLKLEKTPLLKKEDKLTAEDPKYANQQAFNKTHFKAYPFKMKAGQLYIIDMVADKAVGNKIDPYLFLEAPNKNIVATDDDSGGFPNARIMFRPTEDGEYKIIASGLSDQRAIGEYTLTVRTVKEEK